MNEMRNGLAEDELSGEMKKRAEDKPVLSSHSLQTISITNYRVKNRTFFHMKLLHFTSEMSES